MIFVDDLDRCLPLEALNAMESMKAFFDLEGFIFVVGLDEVIIDRALRAELATPGGAAAPAAGGTRLEETDGDLARDYAKRIFQVTYSVPVIHQENLDELLESIYLEAGIKENQDKELKETVRPYLDHIIVHRVVKPKEIKRFINGFLLQVLLT